MMWKIKNMDAVFFFISYATIGLISNVGVRMQMKGQILK